MFQKDNRINWMYYHFLTQYLSSNTLHRRCTNFLKKKATLSTCFSLRSAKLFNAFDVNATVNRQRCTDSTLTPLKINSLFKKIIFLKPHSISFVDKPVPDFQSDPIYPFTTNTLVYDFLSYITLREKDFYFVSLNRTSPEHIVYGKNSLCLQIFDLHQTDIVPSLQLFDANQRFANPIIAVTLRMLKNFAILTPTRDKILVGEKHKTKWIQNSENSAKNEESKQSKKILKGQKTYLPSARKQSKSASDLIKNFENCCIIRPLLSVSRFEISKICSFWKLPIYPDRSNQKVKFLRNRVRKQLVPTVKFFFNSRIENVFLQFADIVETENQYKNQLTKKLVTNFISPKKNWESPLDLSKKLFFAKNQLQIFEVFFSNLSLFSAYRLRKSSHNFIHFLPHLQPYTDNTVTFAYGCSNIKKVKELYTSTLALLLQMGLKGSVTHWICNENSVTCKSLLCSPYIRKMPRGTYNLTVQNRVNNFIGQNSQIAQILKNPVVLSTYLKYVKSFKYFYQIEYFLLKDLQPSVLRNNIVFSLPFIPKGVQKVTVPDLKSSKKLVELKDSMLVQQIIQKVCESFTVRRNFCYFYGDKKFCQTGISPVKEKCLCLLTELQYLLDVSNDSFPTVLKKKPAFLQTRDLSSVPKINLRNSSNQLISVVWRKQNLTWKYFDKLCKVHTVPHITIFLEKYKHILKNKQFYIPLLVENNIIKLNKSQKILLWGESISFKIKLLNYQTVASVLVKKYLCAYKNLWYFQRYLSYFSLYFSTSKEKENKKHFLFFFHGSKFYKEEKLWEPASMNLMQHNFLQKNQKFKFRLNVPKMSGDLIGIPVTSIFFSQKFINLVDNTVTSMVVYLHGYSNIKKVKKFCTNTLPPALQMELKGTIKPYFYSNNNVTPTEYVNSWLYNENFYITNIPKEPNNKLIIDNSLNVKNWKHKPCFYNKYRTDKIGNKFFLLNNETFIPISCANLCANQRFANPLGSTSLITQRFATLYGVAIGYFTISFMQNNHTNTSNVTRTPRQRSFNKNFYFLENLKLISLLPKALQRRVAKNFLLNKKNIQYSQVEKILVNASLKITRI